MFKRGSRKLKLLNVRAITATTWSLVAYLSESVQIFLLRPLLKVLVLIVCWLCDLSGILVKVYLSLLTEFYLAVKHNHLWYVPIYWDTTKSMSNLQRDPHCHLHDKMGHLQLLTKVQNRWNWKYLFCYNLDFLQIESEQEGICPAHFDSISCPLDKCCKSYFQ